MTRYTSFPRLQRFNRDCDFTVNRKLRLNGVDLDPGAPVDKTLLTTRRLRQLYDQRYIAQGPNPLLGPSVPAEIDFAQLPTAAIVEWLAHRRKHPRPNSDRAGIINLARVVRDKEKAKEAANAVVSGKPTEEGDSLGVQGEAPAGDAKKKNSKRNGKRSG